MVVVVMSIQKVVPLVIATTVHVSLVLLDFILTMTRSVSNSKPVPAVLVVNVLQVPVKEVIVVRSKKQVVQYVILTVEFAPRVLMVTTSIRMRSVSKQKRRVPVVLMVNVPQVPAKEVIVVRSKKQVVHHVVPWEVALLALLRSTTSRMHSVSK